MRRFFAENIEGDRLELIGSEAGHIARVLRMQVGDKLVLFDGSGFDYTVEIEAITEGAVAVNILEKVFSNAEPDVNITLCQAVIKHDHFEYAIQKCTELGVREFVPFISERCVKKPKSEERFLERTNRTALEAAKQCGRSLVPCVHGIMDMVELSEFIQGKYALLAYEDEKNTSMKQVLQKGHCKDVLLLIGPEGGFSPKEVEMLMAAGAQSVSLGKLILRAETAGVVASAMVLYECGGQL